MKKIVVVWMALLAGLGVNAPAHAQWAVIDVAAIQQAIQQVLVLKQQLDNAKGQLKQAEDQFRSMTGSRGMERLAGDIARDYLPPEWQELERVIESTSARYGALASSLKRIKQKNAILTAAEIAKLPARVQAEIGQLRQDAALTQTLAREALAATSSRFEKLQSLIEAIGAADDTKAVMDLQARIDAEQAMLVNDQTKVVAAFQAAEAERQARIAQNRERALKDIGSLRALPPIGL
jgi:type IV secretion system protein VirB5